MHSVKPAQSELNKSRVRNTRTPHERTNTVASGDLLNFIYTVYRLDVRSLAVASRSRQSDK